MTAYQISGTLIDMVADTPTTISTSTGTNAVGGNRSISVLKIDNQNLEEAAGITVSLTAPVETIDLDNTTVVPAGGTIFLKVADSNYTGSVYIRSSGASTNVYVQPVVLVG